MSTSRATALRQLASGWLAQGRPAIMVRVAHVRGSTPREAHARMLVGLDTGGVAKVEGTIGGGHLEWQAIALARQALRERATAAGSPPNMDAASRPMAAWSQTFALGPTLGQCCGGTVELHFEPLTGAALDSWPRPAPRFHLDLHGAGHVGQAIIHLLADIDCEVRWLDQRLDEGGDALPGDAASIGLPTDPERATLPPHIHCLPTEDAASEVADARPGATHLVLTHRHDLDLRIMEAILRREDVRLGQARVGLIGSRTKRAAFEHRLLARGHAPSVVDRVHCPIGLPGLTGKEPAVIAISVVAQLLQWHPAT